MRPTTLVLGKTLYWTIRLYTSAGVLVDADSTPTVAVRKNGSSVGDSVTVTKRSATTGIYDCSYEPSGEAEGDQFILEESATISSQAYSHAFAVTILAVMRGTDSAAVAGDAMALTSGERATLTAQIEAALVNEGDATALLQAIADKIAGDLTAGDLTALSIVSAIKNDATLSTMISRIDQTIGSRLAAADYTAPPSASDIWSHGTRTLTSFGTLVSDIWSSGTRTITGLTQAALALFATTDTSQTSAANGSVAKLAQGSGSGSSYIIPASSAALDRALQHNTLILYLREDGIAFAVTPLTAAGAAIDIPAGSTFQAQYRDAETYLQGETAVTIPTAGTFEFTAGVDLVAAVTESGELPYWSLRNSSGKVLAVGPLQVRFAP